MRLLSFTLLLITSSACFAQVPSTGIDPDSIDSEMTKVMYRIAPNDLKTIAYSNGAPSVLAIKLCEACKIKSYTLQKEAGLLLNEQPLLLKNLTVALIKKNFDSIQLGINRTDKTVTYLYLGGIKEAGDGVLNTTKLKQEQSDEY